MYAKFHSDRIIDRVFGCSPDSIASTVLLTPARSIVQELEDELQDSKSFGTWFTGVSGYLDKTFLTILDNIRYAPGMADCVYFLQFAGVQNLLYTGTIGGLDPNMAIGDVVLALDAERGDGASKYFATIFEPAMANTELVDVVRPFLEKATRNSKRTMHQGRIFTTDSLAAETTEFLASLQSNGFLGIEMETSALYIVANQFGMKAIATHAVSDLPLQGKTLFDRLTSKEKERRASAYSAILHALTQSVKALVREGE